MSTWALSYIENIDVPPCIRGQDVVKLAAEDGSSCVIELSFGSKAKTTCRLGLPLRHNIDCAFHLHWIPRAVADTPEFLPEGLLLLEPTWCFSTSEDNIWGWVPGAGSFSTRRLFLAVVSVALDFQLWRVLRIGSHR